MRFILTVMRSALAVALAAMIVLVAWWAVVGLGMSVLPAGHLAASIAANEPAGILLVLLIAVFLFALAGLIIMLAYYLVMELLTYGRKILGESRHGNP